MAAVNLVAPLLLLLGAVSTTLGVGGASLVSRHLGAGDTSAAARAAGNAFTVFWAAAVAHHRGRAHRARAAAPPARRPRSDPRLRTRLRGGHPRRRDRLHRLLEPRPRRGPDAVLHPAVGRPGRRPDHPRPAADLRARPGRPRSRPRHRRRPVRLRRHEHAGSSSSRRTAPTVSTAPTCAPPPHGRHPRGHRRALVPRRLRRDPARRRRQHQPPGPRRLTGPRRVRRLRPRADLRHDAAARHQPGDATHRRVQRRSRVRRARPTHPDPVVARHPRLRHRRRRMRRAARRADRGCLRRRRHRPGRVRQALRIIAIGFAVAGVTPLVSAYFQALGRPHRRTSSPSAPCSLVKVPLVLALGHLGTTGIWTGLAAGELVSAGFALLVLRRLDVPTTRGGTATSATTGGRTAVA